MTTSIKVRKSCLVIKISIHRWVWQGKRWETSFETCAPLSKIIVAIISQNVLCIVVHSFTQGHQSKWVPRLSMVWPHWHNEIWTTVGCGKLKPVPSAQKKWVRDRQKASVVGQINNQAHVHRPTHEQKHVCMISKGAYIRSKVNSCSCKWFAKEVCN